MPIPVAKVISRETKIHGINLIGDYAWLKKPKYANRDTAIMNYINRENAFSKNYFRPLRKIKKGIFKELVAHVKKDDESLPVEDNGYVYYSRVFDGNDHRIYYRHPIGQKDKKEVLLDVNKMAEGYNYYTAGNIIFSPNTNIMAYTENTTESDQYVLKFKDIRTGEILPDSINNLTRGLWTDDQTILYTVMEKPSMRSYQLKVHKLNTPPSLDKVLF